MSEEKKNVSQNQDRINNNDKGFGSKGGKSFSGKKRFADKPKEEFEQRILDVARVTRVMKGGKRMSFRVCVAIGDKKGRVAVALGKGADVTLAVNKAVNKAKKNIINVSINNETIPHEIYEKFGSAKILIKPASKGRGVIAGGVVRVILDLAGIKNVSSKILGTNNKVSNAKCTVLALGKLRKVGSPVIKKPLIEKQEKVSDEKKEK